MSLIKNKQIIVTQDFDANTNKIINLVAGVAGTDAVNVTQLTNAINAVDNSVPTKDDKDLTPADQVANSDFFNTTLAITNTPSSDGYVEVSVNGVQYTLGDGVKTKDSYFSADAGVTAKAIAAIVATDVLYWNGLIAGFKLDGIGGNADRVDFNYNV